MTLDTNKLYRKRQWKDLHIKYLSGVWRYIDKGKIVGFASPAVLESSELYEIPEQNYKIKEKIEMAKNVNYVGGQYKVVEVTYDVNGPVVTSTYFFKADIDLDIKAEDLVVVESSRGYGLVKVVAVFEDSIANKEQVKQATAWVVNIIDMTRHKAKKEASERMEYIKIKLEEKKEQMEELRVYALLAEMDPEAKLLLEEMKSLGGIK